jgi:hypothetical protein
MEVIVRVFALIIALISVPLLVFSCLLPVLRGLSAVGSSIETGSPSWRWHSSCRLSSCWRFAWRTATDQTTHVNTSQLTFRTSEG